MIAKNKKRVFITLKNEEVEALKKRAKRQKKTISELVEIAIFDIVEAEKYYNIEI